MPCSFFTVLKFCIFIMFFMLNPFQSSYVFQRHVLNCYDLYFPVMCLLYGIVCFTQFCMKFSLCIAALKIGVFSHSACGIDVFAARKIAFEIIMMLLFRLFHLSIHPDSWPTCFLKMFVSSFEVAAVAYVVLLLAGDFVCLVRSLNTISCCGSAMLVSLLPCSQVVRFFVVLIMIS